MTHHTFPHHHWFERLSHALLRKPKDRNQLVKLLRTANEHNLLDDEAMRMIEGVLKVSEMQVRDVMVARAQMVVVNESMAPSEALPHMVKAAHSRFPVTSASDPEKIVGILLAKDLLQFTQPGSSEKLRLHDLMRPVTYIPESKHLNDLLREFRLNYNHMAIVVDEYGTIAGLITIEDVLEQIVGRIEDEHDIAEGEPGIKQVGNNQFRVKALTKIEDFNDFFGTSFDDEDCDTFGGLVLRQFSHLPKRGESVKVGPFQVTVLQASARGVSLLKLTRIEEE